MSSKTFCRRSTSARRASSPMCPAPPSKTMSKSRAASTTRPSTPWRSTSPARTSKKAASPSATMPDMSARVVAACREAPKAAHHQALAQPDRHQENARRYIEAGTDAFAVINTLMGMAIDVKTRHPSSATSKAVCRARPSSRSRYSRCIRWHEVAQRTTSRSSAKAASQTRPMPLSSCSPAPPPSASARHCSTTRWCARRSTTALRSISANGLSSVQELVGTLDAPKKTIAACAC